MMMLQTFLVRRNSDDADPPQKRKQVDNVVDPPRKGEQVVDVLDPPRNEEQVKDVAVGLYHPWKLVIK